MINSKNNANLITQNEFYKSNLLPNLDEITAYNQKPEQFNYFSYDYFYIICCLFNDTDADEDGFVTSSEYESMIKHNVSSFTLKRALSNIKGIPFSSLLDSKLNFREFTKMILFEEDKSFKNSIDFWFEIIDLNCDDVIT